VDYKDFDRSTGKKVPNLDPPEARETQPGYWWKEPDPGFRAQMLQAAAAALQKEQATRHNMDLLHSRLYGNFDMAGFGPRQYMRGNISAASKIALNIVESATDTLAAKISKHRPRPEFVTDGAKWAEQRKARRLGHFAEGMFANANVYKKDDLVFIDACILGTGGFHIFMNEDGKVDVERVFTGEIYVDEADGRYGRPRQMIRGFLAHRERLLAKYGTTKELRDLIQNTKAPSGVEQMGFGDMVQVWEGWHLPSSDSAGDGKHCIVIDGGLAGASSELLCEEWKMRRFPFVFFNYSNRMLGFWGKGVAEILTGIQLELNRLIRSISEQLRRKGRGRVFIPMSANVPPELITNAIADVIPFAGSIPPVVDNANAVASEEFQQIDRLWQKGFQIVGASEMSVSAKKPAGLDAGVALREYEEIESERFAKQHQRWDTFHVELIECMLDFVRHFGGEGYVTKYEHKKYMETIEWDDVKHEPGEYAIKIFPSSSLPGTPAAKRQAIVEMMGQGFITKARGQVLLDMPDLEAESNLALAGEEDADCIIETIMDEDSDEVEAPDKYSNMELIVDRATAAYLFAKHHGASENQLRRLSALIDMAAQKVLEAKKAQMPAPTMPAPPAPGPAGMAPPPGAPNMTFSPQVNMPTPPAVPPNVAGPQG
jgi:hypothetical protein